MAYASSVLKKEGHEVYGIDSYNDYYDPELKYARAKILEEEHDVKVERIDLFNHSSLVSHIYSIPKIDLVIHLAAYASV